MRSILVVAVIAANTFAWAQSTLIERSLERIKASPPVAADSFDFIVVADSNSLDPLVQSDIFRGMVQEFNVWEPNLVVQAGDIILGGAAEGVPPQWDLFDQVIAELEPPYLPLPGNHDISDEATEKIWLERMGPTHYSFEYGNACFIMMNTEEAGDEERISDAQVAWLTEQLERTKAEHIFVLLHRPYFEHLGDPDEAAESWQKRWAHVAQAFKGHPVRVVFAGHEHTYRDCGVRDGVRYVICGGASVYGMSDGEDEGDFNHYLHVRVRGNDVSWSVIKAGSVLPEDVVTSDRIQELYRVRHEWIAAEELLVPVGETVDREQRITISNPHDTDLKSTVTWETKPGWTVTPESMEFEAPAGGSKELVFHVAANDPSGARFPVPVFRTRYEQTQFGPPVEVEQELPLVPEVSAVHAQGVTIDASLGDWMNAQWAPVTYPAQYDGTNTEDLAAKVAFQWEGGVLYMAVETQDNEHHQPYAGDIVWSADNVEMFLDEWSYGLTLTNAGPEVFMYRGTDVSGEVVVPEVPLAVTREGSTTTYEAAFPEKYLAPLTLEAGQSFRFNMLMNDLDPSGPEPKRHWLQLVPEKALGGVRPTVKVTLQE